MASIIADTQIPRYTLSSEYFWILLFFLITSFSFATFGQTINEPNPRSKKYLDKAEEAIRQRDFTNGIAYYHRAIEKDSTYAKAYLRLAQSYELLREVDTAFYFFDQFLKKNKSENISATTQLKLAQLYYERGRYQTSKELLDQIPESSKNEVYERILRNVNFALENSAERRIALVETLSDSVNRFYNQYFPSVTVDGGTLIYTARNGISPKDDENLMISQYVDGAWAEAASISDQINSKYNEGAATISANGRMLIFTSCEELITLGSCDLFVSYKTGDNWSKPRNLGNQVNSIYWDSQPSISADGRTLYFSSNRPGGQGNRDIWMTTWADHQWSKPVNLGKEVNTGLDEVTPFIHPNNSQLFFSSNGHVGFGGYDLFQFIIGDTLLSLPSNLGYGINDHLDQISMIVMPDGRQAYYAQDVKNESGEIVSKIVSVSFQESIIQHKASFVYGHVFDKVTGDPLDASIQLKDLNHSKITYETSSDKVNGSFLFVLPNGNTYGVWVEKEGYLFEDFNFDVSSINESKPDTLTIYLQPITVGASLVLENIYFEFDSHQLNPKSKAELESIASYIDRNNLLIEISGHTDKQGSDAHNIELSKLRAKAVFDYLIGTGIDPELLTFKGNGSKYPLSEIPGEEFRNRRIEFKILEKDRKK